MYVEEQMLGGLSAFWKIHAKWEWRCIWQRTEEKITLGNSLYTVSSLLHSSLTSQPHASVLARLVQYCCCPISQCFELKLRWHFCVHSSICPEIYIWSKFWIIFGILNTKFQLGFAQKHVWNIIEEIVFRSYDFLLLSETISSIIFQICFWASPSWNLGFDIKNYSKLWL